MGCLYSKENNQQIKIVPTVALQAHSDMYAVNTIRRSAEYDNYRSRELIDALDDD